MFLTGISVVIIFMLFFYLISYIGNFFSQEIIYDKNIIDHISRGIKYIFIICVIIIVLFFCYKMLSILGYFLNNLF